jgi:hypothetical protein
MSRRKVIAHAVGFAGCAAAGWGIYTAIAGGGCGPATHPCPPEWSAYVLAGGMVAAIFATVLGGTWAVFLGLFLAIGAGAVVAALRGDSDDRVGMLVFGGIFLGVVLLPVLAVPFALRKRRRARRLLEHGTQAIGTVTAFRDTGVTINKQPRVALTVRIEPQDGSSTFEGEKTITVSRLEPPYVGQRFPVWFDPDDRDNFMIATDVTANAPTDVRRLFALAAAGDPGRPGTGGPDLAAAVDPLDRLAKLNELRLAGALTEAEFEAQKAKILNGQT